MTENEKTNLNETPETNNVQPEQTSPTPTPEAPQAAPIAKEQTPAAVSQPKNTVVKPTTVQAVRKGRKLSPRLVVLGCIGFITIFILGLFGALYVGLQNPARLANIGIAPSDAKSLLMIIA